MNNLKFKAYEIFKTHFSEGEAEVVLSYFEQKTEKKYEEKRDILATKEDIHQSETKISQDINRLELKIGRIEGTLETKMEANKSEILKWMFIFWASSTIATLGGLLAIIRFTLR